MLSVHQQEEGRFLLIVACGFFFSLDEGLISLGRFCLESPFFVLFLPCALIFLCRSLEFMPPVFLPLLMD